jgi:hypothetical protein
MPKARILSGESFITGLQSLVTKPEVLRLINDIISCSMEWLDQPEVASLKLSGGLEFFPSLTMHFQRHPIQAKGLFYPNLQEGKDLVHLILLEFGGATVALRLRTSQSAILLSPFHCRFLSVLFSRLLVHYLSLAFEGQESFLSFTPYSLEEQVVAGYLQSLYWAPCATIKLDADDNPYLGSMLPREKDLRRCCEMPGSPGEENAVRYYRMFKSLLYYSVEGERLYTGFAFLTISRPLDYYQDHLSSLVMYHPAHHTSLEEGLPGFRQFLLTADGRSTFLAMYEAKIVGLLELTRGAHRHLATVKAWRSILYLATVSSQGRISFKIPLRGRKSPLILFSILEYRHGHLHIPLFQDVFWRELEGQLREACPGIPLPDAMLRLKSLLDMLRRSGHGGIFLIGFTDSQLATPDTPLENQVLLAQPVPLYKHWLNHLLGLAKSDGALVFNDRLEACQFQARLKPTNVILPVEKDDLGNGMRHQATREFSACCPNVLGISISQDAHISLYRQGKLISRLY